MEGLICYKHVDKTVFEEAEEAFACQRLGTTERLLFPDIFDKPTVVAFDQRQSSSDGGAVLLRAAERGYGLISGMAGWLRDDGTLGRSIIRCEICLRSACSRLPAAIPMPTTRPVSGPIPFTNAAGP
ncbi:hypothetical protein [Edaphobacter aggregans]|uniref:hypothetical protein n=1 Tax=Edaphobacter aggregans TaxID=570835 RepID=UPI0005540103|nr:hypothetical protein [Edaphobacter aggregans]